MKRTLTAVALLAGLMSHNSFAAHTYPMWTGTFKDTQGGLMVMLEDAGKVNVSGADSGSIYRLVCTPQNADSNIANCTGDGINYEQADKPQRFTYRSQLTHQKDGSISEEWECVFEFKSDRRNGKSLFKRVSGSTR